MDYRYIDWKSLQEKTNPFIFKSKDGHPISFYFHTNSAEVKSELEKLVQKNGGLPVEEYTDMTLTTLLMVDDNSESNFYGRVCFRISYIIDCVRTKSLRDINEYIHNSVSKVANKNYMKVMLLREGDFFTENSIVGIIENGSSSSANSKESLKDSEITSSENGTEFEKNIESNVRINSTHHVPLDYQVEQRNHSLLNIHKYNGCVLHRKQLPCNMRKEKESNPRYSSIFLTNSKCNSKKREKNSSGESYAVYSQAKFQEEGSKVTSNNYRKLNPEKHTRQFYSRKEKEAILKYIVKKDYINSVGGVILWRNMERSNICPRRTWMSMQNHFRRKLIHELETFPFLTANQIRELRS